MMMIIRARFLITGLIGCWLYRYVIFSLELAKIFNGFREPLHFLFDS